MPRCVAISAAENATCMRLGRRLRWTEDGLEYERSDRHRQALLVGLGLSDGARRDWTRRGREHAGGNGEDEVQEFGGDAELHELGQVRCATRREGATHEDGESDTRELEETEEGRQMFDIGDASMEARRRDERGRERGLGFGARARQSKLNSGEKQ